MAFGFVKTLQTQRIHKPANCAPKQPVLALLLANPSMDTSIKSRSLTWLRKKEITATTSGDRQIPRANPLCRRLAVNSLLPKLSFSRNGEEALPGTARWNFARFLRTSLFCPLLQFTPKSALACPFPQAKATLPLGRPTASKDFFFPQRQGERL